MDGNSHAAAETQAGRIGLLREPLLHFALIGAAIFAVSLFLGRNDARYSIDIGAADIARIVSGYQRQYGAPPSPVQLRALIDADIKQEIYFREGEALGLGRDDEIVRRRVAQKFEFLQQDAAAPPEPTDADLQNWYETQRDAYVRSERRSFDQIYFAMDKRGEAAAQAAAEKALADISAGKPAPAGDAFPGPSVMRLTSRDEIMRLFGGQALATGVFAGEPGKWAGPYRSGFGWHLVRVSEVEPGGPMTYEEARDDVRADWLEVQGDAQARAAYEALMAKYKITRPDQP